MVEQIFKGFHAVSDHMAFSDVNLIEGRQMGIGIDGHGKRRHGRGILKLFRPFCFCLIWVFLLSVGVWWNPKDSVAQEDSTTFELFSHKHIITPLTANLAALRLDDKSYTSEEIIWDFTNVAFSGTLWLENEVPPWRSVTLIEEALSKSSIIPRVHVINKWKDDIIVGIGWSHTLSYLNGLDQKASLSYLEEYGIQVKQLTQDIFPELEKLTGLRFRFVSPMEESKTNIVANVRIIPTSHTFLHNRYKMANSLHPDINSHDRVTSYLARQVGFVPYTPYSRSQVDGYFTPRADNSISEAVCRISVLAQGTMLNSLISECLVRALGLPSLSKLSHKSLLGNWNEIADKQSRIPSDEGKAAFDFGHGEEKYPPPLPSSPPSLLGYDKKQIELLYCPALKAGMDKITAVSALIKNPECLNRITYKGRK